MSGLSQVAKSAATDIEQATAATKTAAKFVVTTVMGSLRESASAYWRLCRLSTAMERSDADVPGFQTVEGLVGFRLSPRLAWVGSNTCQHSIEFNLRGPRAAPTLDTDAIAGVDGRAAH